MLSISFEEELTFLKVSIEDNGIGRTKSSEINKKNKLTHESKVTNITEQRITMLSGNNPNKIKLQIIDLKDKGEATGTKVVLLIPML